MFSSQKIHYSYKHDDLINRLNEIADKFTAAKDKDNTNKMLELIKKFQREEIAIAFCGHFSSGKSSIINKLIHRDILPTSPIPTKSNIVKISFGAPKAKITLKDNTIKEISFQNDIEMLQKYCLDLQNVQAMEIYQDFSNGDIRAISLLDTPGVDSLEEAKVIAGDTSLYLADAVIYVMDYNHVQSEVNFNFTKLFKDLGKPVYLVINQIDKHCDFEIDFEYFKDSVASAFESWNIKVDGIFFTSLLEESHPENQLAELQAKITSFIADKDYLIVKSTVDASLALVKAHIKKIEASMFAKKEEYLAVTKDFDLEEINAKLAAVRDRIASYEKQLSNFESEIRKEAFGLLEISRLTPYQTTELARDYLESRKEGFRVGLLFAGKKTEQEINRRLTELHKDFAEKVRANLDWHLKEILRKIPEKYQYSNEEYLNNLYALNVGVTTEMLDNAVNTSSAGAREYVVNYCNDISSEIKTKYRQQMNELISYLLDFAQNKINISLQEFKNKEGEYTEILEAANKLSLLDAQTHDYQNTLQNILLGRTA